MQTAFLPSLRTEEQIVRADDSPADKCLFWRALPCLDVGGF